MMTLNPEPIENSIDKGRTRFITCLNTKYNS